MRGRRRRAVDSTILADDVATQDTVTQLVSVIRRVAREVPGAAEQIAVVCTGHDYASRASRRSTGTTRPRRTRWCQRWSTTRTRWWPRSTDAELEEEAASAVALLALVAGQDVEPAEGSDGTDGRWRIARKVAEDG